VKSGGGVFEITIDGKLEFSKKATGRFPEESEIKALVG
jgi:selT/selW/selH-like putative selenoprotein